MPASESDSPRFEESLAELEQVLRDLEDGTTTLDDALARYERGVGLLRRCYGQLAAAEQKIQFLAGLTADGGPDLKPFEHTAAIETARSAVRKPPPARGKGQGARGQGNGDRSAGGSGFDFGNNDLDSDS